MPLGRCKSPRGAKAKVAAFVKIAAYCQACDALLSVQYWRVCGAKAKVATFVKIAALCRECCIGEFAAPMLSVRHLPSLRCIAGRAPISRLRRIAGRVTLAGLRPNAVCLSMPSLRRGSFIKNNNSLSKKTLNISRREAIIYNISLIIF